MEEWRYSFVFLDLGTRWRWVVSFTPRPLYSHRKRPQYRLDRRLGVPQRRSEPCGVQEKDIQNGPDTIVTRLRAGVKR
jgi:hypothetical protein